MTGLGKEESTREWVLQLLKDILLHEAARSKQAFPIVYIVAAEHFPHPSGALSPALQLNCPSCIYLLCPFFAFFVSESCISRSSRSDSNRSCHGPATHRLVRTMAAFASTAQPVQAMQVVISRGLGRLSCDQHLVAPWA